jgi:pyruvate-formate lyase
MTPRIERLRKYTVDKEQSVGWKEIDWTTVSRLKTRPDDSPLQRALRCFLAVLDQERKNVRIVPDEEIVFMRSVKNLPERYSVEEMDALRSEAYYHELGVVFNVTPDYETILSVGLDERRKQAQERKAQALADGDLDGVEFLDAAIAGIDGVCELTDAYRAEAIRLGKMDIAERLAQVPRRTPRSFLEALQALRILHFALWCEGTYHNGVGRIDQYLFPYLQADLELGRLNEGQALEYLEEFFISFNRDSDLYVGVQQGDNGQSLMLGGCDAEGNDASNLLTEMALTASREVRLIDPKINLRVCKKTPIELLEKAVQLTKIGLGFPQYANDDVVIPGLVHWGYDLADARNYVVAACWEFIIPGVGMDIPNIDAVSFPAVVDSAMRTPEGRAAKTFEDFLVVVRKTLFEEADKIEKKLAVVKMLPCPFTSALFSGSIESARDVSLGNKYNNFGIHGTGCAPAVDSLAAIKRIVFDEKKLSISELTDVVDSNFEGHEKILAEVRNEAPKMGCDDPEADELAILLLDWFADSWEGRRNCRGGIFRPGTGSAMYYISHPKDLPASPDGRLRGEFFPANYAPSLGVQTKGPLAVVRSFTKPNLERVVNGGPLTMELHDSVFRTPESVEKVARMAQFFILSKGSQLQLNTINRNILLDAQKNPMNYRNLIVRVWGWSGYFVELDKPYQDQIIQRAEMTF